MFERYTERARRVLFFARYEASQLGSISIETEHLLLGLIREGKGLTSRIFARSHLSLVQAGPHRFVSLMSREAADELGLEPGVLAVAAVKATNVSVEIPRVR